MEQLLKEDSELYLLNSNAKLLKELKKILKKAKESEQFGDKDKAVAGYLKIEKKLNKARIVTANAWDVSTLEPLLDDVHAKVRQLDPIGLIQEDLEKRKKNSFREKFAKVFGTPRQQPRLMFFTPEGQNVMDLPPSAAQGQPNQLPASTQGLSSESAIVSRSSSASSSSSVGKKGRFRASPGKMSPLVKVAALVVRSSPAAKPISARISKLKFLSKKATRTSSSDSVFLHGSHKPKEVISVVEKIGLETSTSEKLQSTVFDISQSSRRLTLNVSSGMAQSILDTMNANPAKLEETYRLALVCVFFPTHLLVSTRSLVLVLQNAFGFSKEKQRELEDRVLSEVTYEQCASILASQMKSIEDHPFYSKSNFKDETSFTRYVELERERMRNQLVEFQAKVTKSAESLPDWKPKNYHKHFSILLRTLVRHELFREGDHQRKREEESLPVPLHHQDDHCVRQRSLLLCPFSTVILEEFGDRYGIRKLHRDLSLFEILSNIFQPTEDFLHYAIDHSKDILSMLRSNEPITIDEGGILSASTAKLHKLIKHHIVNAYKLFKTTESQKILKHFVELLGVLCQIDSMMSSYTVRKIEDLLLDYQQLSVKKRYKEMLERDQAEYGGQIGANQIMNLIDEFTLDIGASSMYEKVYKKYFDITEVVAESFFSLVESDITRFFSTSAMESSPKEVLSLCTKLALLNKRFPRRARQMDIRNLIVPFLRSWMDKLKKKFSDWVENAVKIDKWTPIDKETLVSSSAVDLFCMFSEPSRIISELPSAMSEKEAASFATSYGSIVSEVIVLYAKRLSESLTSEYSQEHVDRVLFEAKNFSSDSTSKLTRHSSPLPEGQKKETNFFIPLKQLRSKLGMKSSSPNSSPLVNRALDPANQLTPSSCIRMNNLEFARTKLSEMIESQPIYEHSFDEAFSYLKKKLDWMLMWNVLSANLLLQKELNQCIRSSTRNKKRSNSSPTPSDTIMTYLDRQLEVLYDNLFAPLFRRILCALWEVVVQDVKKIGAPGQKKLKEKQIKNAEQILEELKSFFHAGGKGLSSAQIAQPLESLRLKPVKANMVV